MAGGPCLSKPGKPPGAISFGAARRAHRELLLRNAIQHDRDLQQVSDQLFIGSVGGVLSPGALTTHGVTHVLCVSTGVKEEILQSKAPDVSISVAPLRDSAAEPSALLQALPMLLGFMATVLSEGHVILVCSFRGWSRAAAVIIAHLMFSNNFSMREAAACVAAARPCAVPNSGFVCALLALEAALTAECLGDSSEVDAEQLRSVAEAAISALPHVSGAYMPKGKLELGDGYELISPEGLDDFSQETIAEEVEALQRHFGLESSRCTVSDDGDSTQQESTACATSSEMPVDESLGSIDAAEAIQALQAQREQLLCLKQQAIAADDFEAAAQARDGLRIVDAQVQQLLAAPTDTEAVCEQVDPHMEIHREEQRLQARREELIQLKEQAIRSDDFEAAAQARDSLRSVEAELQRLGAVSSSWEERQAPAGAAGKREATTASDANDAGAREAVPSRRADNEERLQRLLQLIEAQGGSEDGDDSRSAASGSSSQEPQALTLRHKFMLYPVVVILVLLSLMVLHSALIDVVLRFAPGQEI